MSTPAEFEKRMMLRAISVREAVSHIVRHVAAVAAHEAIATTPADTGQARSNWITTIDDEFPGTIRPYAPGNHLGIGETGNLDGAMAQCNLALSSFSVYSKRVIIQNNLSYIGVLNDGGHSKQGDHMIDKALVAARAALQGVKIFRD